MVNQQYTQLSTVTNMLFSLTNSRTLLLNVIIWLSVFSQVTYAELTATVDRKSLTVEETLTLRVRLADENNQGQPDFSLLDAQFSVLSQHQSSQVQYSNGKMNSYTEWVISLAPKRKGKLLIPSFNHLGFYSDAIEINVTEAAAAPAGTLKEIFIETVLEKPSVYVQEQIILKYRLYYSRNVESLDAEPLELDNVTLESLEDARYRRSIDGKPFNVAEFNYAIYPQESGELVIPALVWQLKVSTSQRPRSFFDTGRYEIRRLRTQEKRVEVKPQPDAFPSHKTWLPAANINLTESWSADIESIELGEPITRTINVVADSLMSSQLPEILKDSNQNELKIYKEQATLEDKAGSEKIISTRIENAAYVVSRSGKITIPAIEVPWWDTNENRLKYAKLPEKVITLAQSQSVNDGFSADPQALAPNTLANENNTIASTNESSIRVWQLATLIFALLWIATLLFSLLSRNKNTHLTEQGITTDQQNEKRAFKQLEQACTQNQALEIKNTLSKWAQFYLNQPSPVTFIEVKSTFSNLDLDKLLDEIDRHLYAKQHNHPFTQGLQLLSIIKQILKSRNHEKKRQSLEPLYYSN